MNIDEARQLAKEGFFEKNGKRWERKDFSEEGWDAVLGFVQYHDEAAKKPIAPVVYLSGHVIPGHVIPGARGFAIAPVPFQLADPEMTPHGWTTHVNDDPSISTIVDIHNAAHLLPQTLRCVKAQTVQPNEVIIVADACTLEEVIATQKVGQDFGYPVHVTNFGNSGKTRNYGLALTKGAYVHHLNGDGDTVTPGFYERGIIMLLDRRIGAAYGEGHYSGNKAGERPTHGQMWRGVPAVASSAYLMRRAAIADVGGWDEAPDNFSRDGFMVKGLLRQCWRIVAMPGEKSYWHRHDGSLEAMLRRNADPKIIGRQVGLQMRGQAPLCILALYSGRPGLGKTWLEQVLSIEYDRRMIDILVLDDSPGGDAAAWPQLLLAGEFHSVVIVRSSIADRPTRTTKTTHEKNAVVGRLYREAFQALPERSQMILTWEDDVRIVDPHALAQLVSALPRNAAAVCGAMPSRADKHSLGAWIGRERIHENEIVGRAEMIEVDMVHFGFTLLIRWALSQSPMLPIEATGENFIAMFCRNARAMDAGLWLNPTIRLEHLTEECGNGDHKDVAGAG